MNTYMSSEHRHVIFHEEQQLEWQYLNVIPYANRNENGEKWTKKKNGGVKVCEKESQASIRERPRTIDEKKN